MRAGHPTIPTPGPGQLAEGLPAGEALGLIWRQQLRAIEEHLPGTRAGRDPEELHDLRVAVRRTRSALSEFRKLLSPEQHEHFRGEFRWLGEVTGPVRDLDVYLHKLPAYRQMLSPEDAAALEPFRHFLQHHRREERRRLVRRLDSARLKRLLADWRRFLGTGDSAGWPESATRPTGEVARRHIWKLYQRFLRKGAAIQAESPDRDLHELRITGKKLRYLVEFFRTLQPPAEIELLIKAMKDIQDFLGDYQDCTVQQTRLDLMARQMTTEGAVPAETLAALSALIKSLRQLQRRARRRFPERFRTFSQGRGRRGFERLFAPPEAKA